MVDHFVQFFPGISPCDTQEEKPGFQQVNPKNPLFFVLHSQFKAHQHPHTGLGEASYCLESCTSIASLDPPSKTD